MKPTTIIDVRPADANNQVLTVVGGQGLYRKTPCDGCPWKTENDQSFPAEAFRHSANTAYDMAEKSFGCHESGTKNPATCAGFLLNGSAHNLKVRMQLIKGDIDWKTISDGGHELHQSYAEMAVANGVDVDDPVLKPCR